MAPEAAGAAAQLDRLLSLVSVGNLRGRLHDLQRDSHGGWRFFLVRSSAHLGPERTEPVHRSESEGGRTESTRRLSSFADETMPTSPTKVRRPRVAGK